MNNTRLLLLLSVLGLGMAACAPDPDDLELVYPFVAADSAAASHAVALADDHGARLVPDVGSPGLVRALESGELWVRAVVRQSRAIAAASREVASADLE
jgi:hypothetical protein